jgi:hypothetical protein
LILSAQRRHEGSKKEKLQENQEDERHPFKQSLTIQFHYQPDHIMQPHHFTMNRFIVKQLQLAPLNHVANILYFFQKLTIQNYFRYFFLPGPLKLIGEKTAYSLSSPKVNFAASLRSPAPYSLPIPPNARTGKDTLERAAFSRSYFTIFKKSTNPGKRGKYLSQHILP